MKTLLTLVTITLLIFCVSANASTVSFIEITENDVSLWIDGARVTADGGRVSNLVINNESISFDLTLFPGAFLNRIGYTNLLEPNSTEVSDRLIWTVVNGLPTYHVQFGSDPELPDIPPGAVDLTTFPEQGLPPNPYFEDGTLQYVGRAFGVGPNGENDNFYIQSDVSDAPEPCSLLLLAAGLAGMASLKRHK